jgi:membrane-bound lytic murein transglycosylase D
VMDLVNWNNLDLQEGIKPGQVLRLTPPAEVAAKTEEPAQMNLIHEVKATDTVYSIARKYGVTIKDLMEWNNKRDFNLAVGEKLKIVKK